MGARRLRIRGSLLPCLPGAHPGTLLAHPSRHVKRSSSALVAQRVCSPYTPLTTACAAVIYYCVLQGLNYDAAAAEELEQMRQREVAEVRAAKEAVEVLGAHLSALDFTYR